MLLQVQRLAQILKSRVKTKHLKIKFFCKLLLKIKLRYICCGLHVQINKKPIWKILKFHVVEVCKNRVLIDCQLREKVLFSSFEFPKARVILCLCYLQYRKTYSFMSYLKTFCKYFYWNKWRINWQIVKFFYCSRMK